MLDRKLLAKLLGVPPTAASFRLITLTTVATIISPVFAAITIR
jgi:hypothetical protein